MTTGDGCPRCGKIHCVCVPPHLLQGTWVIPTEILGYEDKLKKLQARLEAAEAVCEALAEGVNCVTPPRYDVFSLLNNWRKVKGDI